MHILSGLFLSNAARKLFVVRLCFLFSLPALFAQETDSALYALENSSISHYSAIHYKGSAKIDINEQQHNCQFNFVNVVDSFLYIQANMAGIEVFRVFSTPDKILFINKFERNYYDGDYFSLFMATGIDFDFFMLQDIFNGVPNNVPFGASVSYSGELGVDDYFFFRQLTCVYDKYVLRLDIKKVTFDDAPSVSATIPKNFTPVSF
jgi:hypothetical protein